MVPLTEVVSGGSRQSSQNFCIQSQEFRMEMSTQTCSFSNAASLPSPLRLVGPDSQNNRRYLRGGGGAAHSSPVQVFGRSWGVPVAIGSGIRGCLELEAGGGGGRGGGAIVLVCTYFGRRNFNMLPDNSRPTIYLYYLKDTNVFRHQTVRCFVVQLPCCDSPQNQNQRGKNARKQLL
jgi:hypothetical protein